MTTKKVPSLILSARSTLHAPTFHGTVTAKDERYGPAERNTMARTRRTAAADQGEDDSADAAAGGNEGQPPDAAAALMMLADAAPPGPQPESVSEANAARTAQRHAARAAAEARQQQQAAVNALAEQMASPATTDNGDGGGRSGGVLRLFEENATPSSAAANIGKSNYNSRWIRGAYGQAMLSKMKDRPVICSGSTIGDAVAIEAYLRAMVAQFDTTGCKQVGCDQGMHNYLYYSNSLEGVEGICEVITYKQGQGIVNNLAAMRNSPLRQQGVLVDGNVINWDSSISAVAHQYDRDKELERLIKDRVSIMMAGLDIS